MVVLADEHPDQAEPEIYKEYFLWGFLAKIGRGIVFDLVYFYHYQGGDSIMYFYSAILSRQKLAHSTAGLFRRDVRDNSMENWERFDLDTGYPYGTCTWIPLSGW